VARAQLPKFARIGVLIGIAESDPEGQDRVATFRQALQELGWSEGRNVRFDVRLCAGDRRGATRSPLDVDHHWRGGRAASAVTRTQSLNTFSARSEASSAQMRMRLSRGAMCMGCIMAGSEETLSSLTKRLFRQHRS